MRTKTKKGRGRQPTNPIPNLNPDSSGVVSTGKNVIMTRQRKRLLDSSSTVPSTPPPISTPNTNLNPNPSHVVSTDNHMEISVILTRQRKRKLMSSSTSTINPETQVTQNRSSSSTSTVNSPSPITRQRKRELPSSSISTIKPPSPTYSSNPSPKSQMKLTRPPSSILKKKTCTTSRSSITSPNITSHSPIANREVIAIRDFPSPIRERKQETSSFTCFLCFWSKKIEDRLNVKGCNHFYCKDCIRKYIGSKLESNVVVIGCPGLGCSSKLELEFCWEALSRDVLDRWGDALCESLIQASQKFYCPFKVSFLLFNYWSDEQQLLASFFVTGFINKDCSALLMNDGGEVVMESECPYCRRLVCAQCKAPWHAEIKCEEFQRLKKDEQDDMKMKALAEKERWTRCPICNFYVQKVSGCNFIKCRDTFLINLN